MQKQKRRCGGSRILQTYRDLKDSSERHAMSRKPTLGHSEVAFPVWPICQKFNLRYIELDDELKQHAKPSSSQIPAFWQKAGERMEAATITIVFAASFLDQFIYKYGCNYFGIEDCEKEFDRLSLRAKWLKIPERAVGKGIPEKSDAIAMLDELVQVRHKIIHYKVFDLSGEAFNATESLAKLTHKCARNTVPTVNRLMEELGKVDGGQGFQKFLKDFLRK
jgi:hypothetical protein